MRAEPTTNSTSANIAAASVTELLVTGMNCQNCARHVTEAIQSVAGVRTVSVMLDAGRASVRWSAVSEPNVPAVLQAIKQAGYEAKAVEEAATQDHSEQHVTSWQSTLWIGVLATGPLMVGEWVFGFGLNRWFQWLSFALAGVVQILAGAQFYRGAWRQLKHGSSNMDTLVALGSTTAFGYSTWALLSGAGGHVYFMEAASIITLISVGHWVEARMSARASSTLKGLLNLAPQTARRRNADGSETEVLVTALRPGDQIALKPGDRVPTDGVVVDGASAVDESMLTGESLPVDKTASSELYAGTANLNGRLVMRVMATGETTALGHIVAAVQRAQTSRASIQRLGDRVSSAFVPAVVLVAVSAGLWWGLAPESARQVHISLAHFLWPAHPPVGALAAAFISAAAVLIIACPCAMGLATPAAIMAGSNAAARRGILIRDGVALEKAGKVTAVIFDKTGTLTSGKPEVAEVFEVHGSKSEVRSLAAMLARHSTHPISQAIAASYESVETIDGAVRNESTVETWREIRGAGIAGNIGYRMSNAKSRIATMRLGSLRWLRDTGVDLIAGESFANAWSGRGATVVGLGLDSQLLALFALRDPVKRGAAKVVQQLMAQGLRVHLLTGDNWRTAGSVAKQVGISAERVFAEGRPEEKAQFVKKLQAAGEHVAFVGDGINDAPALEQADLGIAVSRASDIAREAADMVLLKSAIEAVPESLGLARATLRTIKQNLFWAFCYNAIGVPLAALGFMSPILCAAAMGLSDLIVIGNALRLLRWGEEDGR